MFGETIGIDLGSSFTRIYLKGQGIVLSEPTVAAVECESKKILCVGCDAEEMVGRTPKNVYAIRPVKHGVISDFHTTEKILKYFVKKACGNRLFKPSAIISVPGEISQVSERAVIDAAISAGIKNVELTDVPIASSMGAGIDISVPRGSLIVDIGAERCDVAVISTGGIVLNSSIKTGGSSFDRAISDYVKKEKRIIIGERVSKEIKTSIATLNGEEKSVSARGRCLLTGLPKTFEITSEEIMPQITSVAMEIVFAIVSLLENTPPQLICDISESEIVICGGSANLEGIDKLLEKYTGIRCIVAENSADCTIKGIGKFIEEEDIIYNKAL